MRLLPFLLDGGRYRFVKTKLIHFRRFKEVDISRTRLSDKERGYQWDRCISYLKGMEWFIVFDIVKITKDGAYTLANLFYTQDIVDLDEKDRMWYDTQYRTLSRMVHSSNRYYWTFFMEFARQFPADFVKFYQFNNPHQENTRLLMYFPEGLLFRRGVEQPDDWSG